MLNEILVDELTLVDFPAMKLMSERYKARPPFVKLLLDKPVKKKGSIMPHTPYSQPSFACQLSHKSATINPMNTLRNPYIFRGDIAVFSDGFPGAPPMVSLGRRETMFDFQRVNPLDFHVISIRFPKYCKNQ